MAEKPKFERGTALSIFRSDRAEDFAALMVALSIVALVMIFVQR